jgi:hypothetical protein
VNAIVTINVPPRRMLTAKEAAIYCGVSGGNFGSVCMCPQVLMPGGKKLYDIKDLDCWLDSIKTNAPDSNEAILGRLRK